MAEIKDLNNSVRKISTLLSSFTARLCDINNRDLGLRKREVKSKNNVFPSNREDFESRVSTFLSIPWTIKEISPLLFARHGWRLLEKEIIQCTTCKALLSFSLPSYKLHEAYQKFVSILFDRIVDAHADWCGWKYTPSPQNYIQPPILLSLPHLKNLTNDCLTFVALGDKLPNININELLSNLELTVEDLGILLNEKKPLSAFQQTAGLLVLTGWSPKSSSTFRCNFCLRYVGLWNFYAMYEKPIRTLNDCSDAKKNDFKKAGLPVDATMSKSRSPLSDNETTLIKEFPEKVIKDAQNQTLIQKDDQKDRLAPPTADKKNNSEGESSCQETSDSNASKVKSGNSLKIISNTNENEKNTESLNDISENPLSIESEGVDESIVDLRVKVGTDQPVQVDSLESIDESAEKDVSPTQSIRLSDESVDHDTSKEANEDLGSIVTKSPVSDVPDETPLQKSVPFVADSESAEVSERTEISIEPEVQKTDQCDIITFTDVSDGASKKRQRTPDDIHVHNIPCGAETNSSKRPRLIEECLPFKKIAFNPLREHRHWCGWVSKVEDGYGGLTEGYLVMPSQIKALQPIHATRYSSNAEGLCAIRSELHDWSLEKDDEELF